MLHAPLDPPPDGPRRRRAGLDAGAVRAAPARCLAAARPGPRRRRAAGNPARAAGRPAVRRAERLPLVHRERPASLPQGGRCFSEREQVALAFAAAVAQGAATDGLVSGPALVAARRHFREREIVRLTVLAAGEHFGDGLADRPGADPRPSFPISVRGLS